MNLAQMIMLSWMSGNTVTHRMRNECIHRKKVKSWFYWT